MSKKTIRLPNNKKHQYFYILLYNKTNITTPTIRGGLIIVIDIERERERKAKSHFL